VTDQRRFGLGVAVAIVVANMIGTGVFTSAGYQAASLHDPMTMITTWIVGGVLALCGAAAYAELGTLMPNAGGEYVYLREAYHPAVGFMSGWVSLTAGFSAPIAVSALAFAKYSATLSPALDSDNIRKIIAIGLIVLVTAMHMFDSVIGGKVQAMLTAANVALIVVFIVAGLTVGSGDWSHFASVTTVSNTGVARSGLAHLWSEDFAISLMYVSFAYSGWNAAAYIAGEIKRPERNLPRALLFGTGAVMLLYVLINVVFIYAVSPADLGNYNNHGPVEEVGDAAGRALFGQGAGKALTTLIALALVSAVSAMVMAGPRVYAAMAKDRALPAVLATTSKRGVPTVAVALQAALSIFFVLAAKISELIRYVGFWLAIFAALTVASVFVFRYRQAKTTTIPHASIKGESTPGYKTFGYPVTPALFIALSCWMAYAQIRSGWKNNPKEIALTAGTLLLGTICYAIMRKSRIANGRSKPL
jgi:basic amino acid/polyamine antiporter, APA family